MKKIIKGIIFDYGGVISHKQDEEVIKEICNLINLPKDIFLESYIKFRQDYDSDIITGEEYWIKLLDTHNVKYESDIINKLIILDTECWTKINKKTRDYIFQLSKYNIKKAIISNMTIETLDYMRNNFSWLKEFNNLVFSCEFKTSKPERKIYKKCLELMELSPEECVFIDDSKTNVNAAIQIGFNAVHFTDYDTFIKHMNNKFMYISD